MGTYLPAERTQRASLEAPPKFLPGSVTALERHYCVAEIAKLWGLSESTIRRLFIDEPGVLKIAHEETRFKRRYISLRIPERIALQVHRRLQGVA
jgi:Fic family protein